MSHVKLITFDDDDENIKQKTALVLFTVIIYWISFHIPVGHTININHYLINNIFFDNKYDTIISLAANFFCLFVLISGS